MTSFMQQWFNVHGTLSRSLSLTGCHKCEGCLHHHNDARNTLARIKKLSRVQLLIGVMARTLHTRVEVVLVKNFLHQPLAGSRPFPIFSFCLVHLAFFSPFLLVLSFSSPSHTCGRGAGTHGDVLNVHTGGVSKVHMGIGVGWRSA